MRREVEKRNDERIEYGWGKIKKEMDQGKQKSKWKSGKQKN